MAADLRERFAPRLAYSVREVAELLGCSERTIERRVADGTLPVIRIGKLRRVPASAVHALISGRAAPASRDQEAERIAREMVR